jgi:hypothetical protein
MHRPFVDQAMLKRIEKLPVEFLMIKDNDFRSTGRKTIDLIRMARGEWIMGMGDDDFLHPSFFDWVLPKLRGPRLMMIGFDVLVLTDLGRPELTCKLNPKFGPFPTILPGTEIGVERWEGTTQFRPYAMVSPVRRKLYDSLTPEDEERIAGKSWCEDNYLMAHIIPQLIAQRVHYFPRALYYSRPVHENPDRKEWSTRYDD